MEKNGLWVKVGDKVPEEILNGKPFSENTISCWLNDNFIIYLKDCQNEKDAQLFKQSKITLSICEKLGVIFFLVNIENIGLIFDVAYNVNLTKITEDEIRKGFSQLTIAFVDNSDKIRALRGIHFSEKTVHNIGQLFLEQFENGIDTIEKNDAVINEVYTLYPTSESLIDCEKIHIDWIKPEA